MDVDKLLDLVQEYAEKHDLAMELGGEYIMQNDKAQVDAIQLVCDIFDKAVTH